MNTMTLDIKLEAQVNYLNYIVALFCQPEDNPSYYHDILDHLKSSCENLMEDHSDTINEMQQYIKTHTHKELLVDYTKIFLGPYKAIAHPYSSVYLGDGSLNGPATIWVENFYRLSGYKFNENIKDLADHIAVELEFLYNLKFNELKSLNDGDSDQASLQEEKFNEFFLNHFRLWVPQFCKKVINDSDNLFYSNLCKCLNAFVEGIK